MKILKLLGANKFIDQPTGTFYNRFWMKSREECLDIIKKFKECPLDLIDFEDIEIYGDNSGSMSFQSGGEGPIFYYDANAVGDASTKTTLYLVINEDCIPDLTSYSQKSIFYDVGDANAEVYTDSLFLRREEVFLIRNKFISIFDKIENTYEDNKNGMKC